MDVRVVGHRRPPRVKHGRNADAGAEVLRVRSDSRHSLRRDLEQQAIDRSLVLERDLGDLGRQQVGRALAPRAVPVPAAVVSDPPVPAVGADLEVPAHDRGAAGLYRRHDLELVEAQMSGTRRPVCGTGSAEYVGDLERGAQRPVSRADSPWGCLPSAGRAGRSRRASCGSRPWYRRRWCRAGHGPTAPG